MESTYQLEYNCIKPTSIELKSKSCRYTGIAGMVNVLFLTINPDSVFKLILNIFISGEKVERDQYGGELIMLGAINTNLFKKFSG